jgi:electron transport complex protein RnfE
MILPPGGFAVLGFLLAGKRAMENRRAARATAAASPAPA